MISIASKHSDWTSPGTALCQVSSSTGLWLAGSLSLSLPVQNTSPQKRHLTAKRRFPVAKVGCALANLQSCTLRCKYIEYSGSILGNQKKSVISLHYPWHILAPYGTMDFRFRHAVRVTEPNIQRIFVPKEPKCGSRIQLAVRSTKNEHSLTVPVRVRRVWMHLWWRRIALNRRMQTSKTHHSLQSC